MECSISKKIIQKKDVILILGILLSIFTFFLVFVFILSFEDGGEDSLLILSYFAWILFIFLIGDGGRGSSIFQ